MKGKILATLLCASMALGMMGCGSGNVPRYILKV